MRTVRRVVRGGVLRGRSAVVRLLRSRTSQRRWFQALVVAALAGLAPMSWLWLAAGDRVGTVAGAPAAPVGVVFGAGIFDGKPSPYLAHRLDAAVQLYRAEKIQAVLVTGDNSRTDYDESTVMKTYLVEQGVPAGKVVEDYAGFDTWDSCVRAKRIFLVDRAVLISQSFHARRALALCQAAGIDSYAVGVDEDPNATWYYGGLREIPGAAKAAFDAAFEPDPTFWGEQEHGIGAALARPR
ncbi:vancomycin high temperature exclusion protein [Kitasatospora sp. NPDC096147]|uniref:SanA/YdcF family protein n=1 Tax=Kitasatospora sp. NPDC096147 TaxID=3364093 RepID=UPI003816F990